MNVQPLCNNWSVCGIKVSAEQDIYWDSELIVPQFASSFSFVGRPIGDITFRQSMSVGRGKVVLRKAAYLRQWLRSIPITVATTVTSRLSNCWTSFCG